MSEFLQTVLQSFGPMGSGLLLHLGVSLVLPQQVASFDNRYLPSGLSIEVQRTSPPFVALLDVFEEPEGVLVADNQNRLLLNSENDYSDWAKKRLLENVNTLNSQISNAAVESTELTTHILLPQLTLSRVDLDIHKVGRSEPQSSTILSIPTGPPRPSVLPVTKVEQMEQREVLDEVSEVLLAANRDRLLPYVQNPKVLEAISHFKSSFPPEESLSDQLKILIEEDPPANTKSASPMGSIITGSASAVQTVAKSDGATPLRPWYRMLPEGQLTQTRTGPEKSIMVDKSGLPSEETAPGSSSDVPVSVSFVSNGPAAFAPELEEETSVLASGHLQIEGGLAFMGHSHELVVYREFEGRIYERGDVRVRDGAFDIQMESYRGHLVAEVVDGEGLVLGRGLFELEGNPKGKQTGIEITLTPTIAGVSGQVVSVYSFDHVVYPVSGATIAIDGLGDVGEADAEGRFESQEVAGRSSMLIRARAEGYWDTLKVTGAGYRERIELFPKEFIRALNDNLDVKNVRVRIEEGSSLVWGRVAKDGKPVAGATVNVAGDSKARVFYLNEWMIVDPDQKMTSKNGIFVVAELENDFCVLTAQWGENLSAMNLTPLYPNAVTTLDINFSAKKSLRVSAFDAFHPEVLQPVELEEIGNPEIHQRLVEGKGTLPSLSGKGLAIFETHPELPYLPTRQILSRNQSYLHLPQINSRWVQSIFHSLRVNPGPQMGQVVGFVPDEDFTAYIDGRPLDSTTGFYFDALGKPRDPSLQGSQGGGLFLFNLSPGFHTVSVTTAGTGKILLQMIFVDPQVVSTFYVRTH